MIGFWFKLVLKNSDVLFEKTEYNNCGYEFL